MSDFFLSFGFIAIMHFLAVISPGPDFALVTRNALIYPRRSAIYTALGIALGIVVHLSYCLLGLAIVISKSLLFFNILKYLGAGYLIYLGIKALLPEKSPKHAAKADVNLPPALSAQQAIGQGFLCNALNPKAALFFLGIFTLAIKPGTPWWWQVFFAAWMVIVTFLWFSLLSLIITNPYVRCRLVRIQPWITKIMGVLLIVFGLELALWLNH